MLICGVLHDAVTPPELVKEPETEAEPELWPLRRPSPGVADGDDSKAGCVPSMGSILPPDAASSGVPFLTAAYAAGEGRGTADQDLAIPPAL